MIPVDAEALRADVRRKYGDVALRPDAAYHFHTGRELAAMLGYDPSVVDSLPDRAVESFSGVGNPFTKGVPKRGDRVVDLGSGGGFDCFVAAGLVGAAGAVLGVDMTPEMLAKAQGTAATLGLDNVEFRDGLLEELPVEDSWADLVISNGVINLCADKPAVFAQAFRVLRPGGTMQFADIANGRPVPDAASCEIDLWTGCIGGSKPVDAWKELLDTAGFEGVEVGPPIDAFGGSGGEQHARDYDVNAHVFAARKPS